jgi:Domain of unknown function (DUF4396)
MLESIMMLWFVLTAMSALYVAIDIRHTPEHPVLKWAFILFTLYAGPIGALLYVFGCRRHTPEEHARFVAARWRQVLGSTMHCVAGDGIGILAGAVIGALVVLRLPVEIMLEYVLGFGFGWTIFQALFMRDMAGGSYRRSLESTFIPEFLSMNVLMGGMIPVMALAWRGVPEAHDPTHGLFWFRMSIALMVGFALAYPMNWWLVANHLKHGMMTVPAPKTSQTQATKQKTAGMKMPPPVSRERIAVAAGISFAVLILGLGIGIAGRG